MGLNLSNQQIAQELGLNDDDVHAMASHLRGGLVAKVPEATLEGTVEADEVYVVAGHKGNLTAVQKKVGSGGVDGLEELAAVARWKRKSRRYWV
jgi:hypothetical protein